MSVSIRRRRVRLSIVEVDATSVTGAANQNVKYSLCYFYKNTLGTPNDNNIIITAVMRVTYMKQNKPMVLKNARKKNLNGK